VVEEDVEPHGEEFGVVVLDWEEGEVFLLVEVLQGEEDEHACGLCDGGSTIREMMVKHPPVAEVSYWSILIFLKKSTDLSMRCGD
jgi:hypothetical protein